MWYLESICKCVGVCFFFFFKWRFGRKNVDPLKCIVNCLGILLHVEDKYPCTLRNKIMNTQNCVSNVFYMLPEVVGMMSKVEHIVPARYRRKWMKSYYKKKNSEFKTLRGWERNSGRAVIQRNTPYKKFSSSEVSLAEYIHNKLRLTASSSRLLELYEILSRGNKYVWSYQNYATNISLVFFSAMWIAGVGLFQLHTL